MAQDQVFTSEQEARICEIVKGVLHLQIAAIAAQIVLDATPIASSSSATQPEEVSNDTKFRSITELRVRRCRKDAL